LPEAKGQQELWDAGKLTLYTEKELRDKGVPVTLAGKKGEKPKLKPAPEPAESPLLQPLDLGDIADLGDEELMPDDWGADGNQI
jgi:hypothetical protein